MTQTGKKSYNISLGLPLSHYTLVQDLLNLLELNEQIKTNNIQTALFTQVVTSVYIQGYQLERSSRHMLVNQTLSLSLEYFQLEQLEEAITQCPVLSKLIQTAKQDDTKNQRLDEHLLNFNTTLTNWGFTTDRSLSSSEYQLFNKYLSSSLKLNQLALHQNKCLVKTALYLLKEISSQIVFQAQSSKTNVQIIGSLEAEGLYFDKAWVMGMTHDFLPAKLNSPRFIATDIAIHHQIPHSSYEGSCSVSRCDFLLCEITS